MRKKVIQEQGNKQFIALDQNIRKDDEDDEDDDDGVPSHDKNEDKD